MSVARKLIKWVARAEHEDLVLLGEAIAKALVAACGAASSYDFADPGGNILEDDDNDMEAFEDSEWKT